MLDSNNPQLKSWISVSPNSDFPIQNLPFGVFKTSSSEPRVGVALGGEIIDLAALARLGFLDSLGLPKGIFEADALNSFLKLGKPVWRATREHISKLFRHDTPLLRDNDSAKDQVLISQSKAQMLLPVKVQNYVDFYSSEEHATNVGKMFRDPANALLPNWKHLPVGYNGRSSSIVISGTNFPRPKGQLKADNEEAPIFAPSKQIDFELEMAFITGADTPLGKSISTHEADNHIFGLVLLNDWSARDIQKWEYVPLGPLLGKSFATSLSPWVVTLDALEPFKVDGPKQNPKVLPHLEFKGPASYDIELEALLTPNGMANDVLLCKTNFKYMYWNMAQQLAHLTSNGTNICAGDVYGSGTISGPTEDSFGSLLELCWKGTKPIQLLDGSKRTFLLDGDTLTLKGHCAKNGVRVGFGEVRGTVLPAV